MCRPYRSGRACEWLHLLVGPLEMRDGSEEKMRMNPRKRPIATARPVRRAIRLPRRTVAIGVVASFTVLAGGISAGAAVSGFFDSGFGNEQVGQNTPNGILLPSNQWVNPIGTRRALVTNGRLPSSTLSPDGTMVAAMTWEQFTGFLSLINVTTGKVVQQVGTGSSSDPAIGDGTVAADGPFYSPDGKSLWVPQTSDLLRFAVQANGLVNTTPVVIKLSGPNGPALPSGMAFSADGSKAYVALNGSNTLGVIDTATNSLVNQIPVGNAPRQVVLVGGEAFVSNEGGRPARPGDFTNLSDGTPIVADSSTGAASTGTVSVVDLSTAQQTGSIPVGLEPTAMYLDGRTLLVANSNDDSVSVIDTTAKRVTQTFNVNPLPGSTVGSYPSAITMPDADHILVSIGRDNAIAVFHYNGPVSPVQYQGLLPTDWYPVNVAMDTKLGEIVVTNDKGIGARGPESTIAKGPGTNPATGHNTYDDTGSLTTFSLPSYADLGHYTHQVFVDNGWEHLLESHPAPSTAAAAIPARLGEPSPIKHVFLIVKENRTYDQVFGDIGKGNSDPSLAQFGANVTPNQHALANTFGLFDNFYDEGTLSADGHNWLMQADANDYIEKEFGAFFRSYPAQGGDALAYQRDGFLWNAAQRAGLTAAAFGEYNNFFNVPSTGYPTWQQWYQDSQILEGKASGPMPVPENKYSTYSDIPSLNAIDDHAYPRFDLNVPDQYRTDVWLQSFQQSEKTGNLANLNMLWMPDDHTSGVGSGDPNPIAQVADNDLAVGRVVDAISHSQFWKSSAIFVVEDDPQNGVDHVDGHRSTALVISPYAKRGVVLGNYYTQLNMVKTIEQILGIQPMNQEDRAAEPMFAAFTNHPDFTPYNTIPNQIPLTAGLAGVTAGTAEQAVRSAADGSAKTVIPAAMMGIYRQWAAWSKLQHFGGAKPNEDMANPAMLNRLDWYSATGWVRPYPGDKKILAPDQVPGRNLPANYIGG
jgi:YVTN family beta-propeller protein